MTRFRDPDPVSLKAAFGESEEVWIGTDVDTWVRKHCAETGKDYEAGLKAYAAIHPREFARYIGQSHARPGEADRDAAGQDLLDVAKSLNTGDMVRDLKTAMHAGPRAAREYLGPMASAPYSDERVPQIVPLGEGPDCQFAVFTSGGTELARFDTLDEARRYRHTERRNRAAVGGYEYPAKYQLTIAEATRGDFSATAMSAFTQLLDAAQLIQDKQRLILGSEAEHRPVAGGQRVQTLAEILRAMYVGSPEKWSGMWNLAKPILAQRFGL